MVTRGSERRSSYFSAGALSILACWLGGCSAGSEPGQGSNGPLPGIPERYSVLSTAKGETTTLVRVDTATCRLWKVPLDRTHWRPIAAGHRAPGEGLPLQPGRYRLTRASAPAGPVFVCTDVAAGHVYRMRADGRGGWIPVEESPNELGKLQRQPPEKLGDPVEAARAALLDDPTAIVEGAIESDLPSEIRAFAASQLTGKRARGATPTLVGALQDADLAVVVAAIRALELNADPAALPALEKLLDHPDAEVSRSARAAVERLGSP